MTKETVVRSRGLLFSGVMAQAGLAGLKTETRRVVKNLDYIQNWDVNQNGYSYNVGFADEYGDCHDAVTRCPYGVPGDLLYVRETWAHDAPDNDTCRARVEDIMGPVVPCGPYYKATEVSPRTLRWRPNIHMPRWASRILLELTEVRPERVQDIRPRDVVAEGLAAPECGCTSWGMYCLICKESLRGGFHSLWDSLNESRGYGWNTNPWVWVLKFKILATTHAETQRLLAEMTGEIEP
jgi:hypothetical protein